MKSAENCRQRKCHRMSRKNWSRTEEKIERKKFIQNNGWRWRLLLLSTQVIFIGIALCRKHLPNWNDFVHLSEPCIASQIRNCNQNPNTWILRQRLCAVCRHTWNAELRNWKSMRRTIEWIKYNISLWNGCRCWTCHLSVSSGCFVVFAENDWTNGYSCGVFYFLQSRSISRSFGFSTSN